MARYKHLFELLAIIVAFFALALMVAGTGCQPKSAKELGIVGMSQYELACHILDQAKEVEKLRFVQPGKAKRLAKRNLLSASCVRQESRWGDIKKLAADQHSTVCGPEAGLYRISQLESWERRLRPGGRRIGQLEQEFLASMPSALSDLPYEKVTAVSATDKANGEIRRHYASRRIDAEQFIQKAKEPEVLTPVPMLAAKAYKAKVEADWIELVSVRLGRPLPPEHAKLLAECEKLTEQVNRFQIKNYSDRIPESCPITTL